MRGWQPAAVHEETGNSIRQHVASQRGNVPCEPSSPVPRDTLLCTKGQGSPPCQSTWPPWILDDAELWGQTRKQWVIYYQTNRLHRSGF